MQLGLERTLAGAVGYVERLVDQAETDVDLAEASVRRGEVPQMQRPQYLGVDLGQRIHRRAHDFDASPRFASASHRDPQTEARP